MQSKVKIIRTDDGYMVELPNGDYLCDEHGDNLWDTYDAAWDVVATNYADINSHIEGESKTEEHEWHIELTHMKAQLRYVLNNLDDISKRHDVQGKIENVYFMLDELCEQTKGEIV